MVLDLYERIVTINKQIYSDFSYEYEQRTKNAYENYLKAFIDEFIESLPGGNIYDLGCGPGRDLLYFQNKGLKPIGVDISDKMIEICDKKGLRVINNDFLGMDYEPSSVDGFWAYTSHTVIPKKTFKKLLEKYRCALKKDSGILALGMIEGEFEGFKSDDKYNGANRYVARYSKCELESLLRNFFGSVQIHRVDVKGKVYLHCLCRNTTIAKEIDTINAAKELFDRFSNQYKISTLSGVKLLDTDRKYFIDLLHEISPIPHIIDVGCGPGRDLVELSKLGAKTVGLDISQANIDNCRSQNMDAIVGDIYELDKYFSLNSFDAAWCNCSVTNWVLRDRLPDVIEKVKKIVIPNGYIFFGSIMGNFSGWEINEKYASLRRYNNHWSKKELLNILSSVGTKVYERILKNTGKKDYINVVYRNEK